MRGNIMCSFLSGWSFLLVLVSLSSAHNGQVSAFLSVPRTSVCGLTRINESIIRTRSCPYSSVVMMAKKVMTVDEPKTANQDESIPMIMGVPRDTVAAPLALLLTAQFILFIGVGAVIPSIPLYGKAIGLSAASNGIVISAPAVALLLLANYGGNFSDLARKPAMIYGMALIAIADVGTAFAGNLAALIVARLGLGAGRCISEAGERGMLADLARQIPALRGRALATQQALAALGIAIGAPLGGVIVEEYGVRASFLCVSAAALVTLAIYFLLPETIQEEVTKSNEASGKADIKAIKNARIEQGNWLKLLKENQWKGLALCQCGASVGFACKIASIPLLAAETLPGGAAGAGLLLSAAGLSGLIGAPLGGFLTDQVGTRATIILSGLVSASCLLGIPFALNGDLGLFQELDGVLLSLPSFLSRSTAAHDVLLQGPGLAFSAMVVGWSVGAAAQGPALTALAQEIAPAGAEATSMALPRAAGDGTYIVAPFVLGVVADLAKATSASDASLPQTTLLPGSECGVAGLATLMGVIALLLLGGSPQSTTVKKA